jgi:uncharacterized membrane protein
MKQSVLFVSISVASGVLFANMYTSVVDARAWGSDIPTSIAAAREYFRSVTPADFFRIISPLNQLLAVITLILFWRSAPHVRLFLGAALVMYVLADIMTFTYFYPRNDILFKTAPLADVSLLQKTWSEWASMNWVRTLIVLAGLVCQFVALHRSYGVPADAQ